MEFVFGVSIIGVVISLFVAHGIAHTVATEVGRGGGYVVNKAKYVLAFIGLIVTGNLITLGATWIGNESEEYSEPTKIGVCDIAAQMGLTSEQPYPVMMGSRSLGVSGEGSFQTSFLGGGGNMTIESQERLTLGFDYKGVTTPLILPINDEKHVINFIQDPEATQPSIAIDLNCKKKVDGVQVVHYGPRRLVFDSGMLLWRRFEIGRDEPKPANDKLLDRGLAPIIKKYFKSITIRLTPEMLQRIL